jgi:hypothetical protein
MRTSDHLFEIARGGYTNIKKEELQLKIEIIFIFYFILRKITTKEFFLFNICVSSPCNFK